MKQNDSKNNYEYPSFLPMGEVSEDIETYIIPECRKACSLLWDNNIFTVSCSTSREGDTRYIFISTLSDTNKRTFEDLIKKNPSHYCSREQNGKTYYCISVFDKSSDANSVSDKLISLIPSFEMQDVLEGYLTFKDYYTKYMSYNQDPKPADYMEESELITLIQKNLSSFGKINLLDLDRKVVYDSDFYKNAHQRYLDYLRNQPPTNPAPHDDR